MKKYVFYSVLICGCALILTSGCVSRGVKSVDPRVTLSSSMARQIAVDSIAVKTNAGGLLEGHVKIMSRTSKIRQYEYRVEWNAGGSYTVPSITQHWQPFSLAGYDSHIIRLTAPSPEATGAEVMIRQKGAETVGAIIRPASN